MSRKSESLMDELRRKADELIANGEVTVSSAAGMDVHKLIQELNIHQVELEIQNEELRRAQRELAVARDRYAELYHQAPVGYLVLDDAGMILQVNRTFSEMVAVENARLIRAPFSRFIHPEDREGFLGRWRAFFDTPAEKQITLRISGADDGERFVNIQGRREKTDGIDFGDPIADRYLMIAVSDITLQKNAETALQSANRDLWRHAEEQTALIECSRAILENRSFEETARRIFDAARRVTGAAAGYVALLSEDGEENELLFLESGGADCFVNPDLPMPIRGLRAEAYHANAVVCDNDFHHSRWMRFMPKGHMRLDNVLFAPLVIGEKTVGIMGLANKPSDFTSRDFRMAKAFGEFAAIALMNSRTLEQLRRTNDRLAVTLDSIGDGVITIDENCRIVSMNRAAEVIAGRSSEDAAGRAVEAVLPIHSDRDGRRLKNPSRQAIETGKVVLTPRHVLLKRPDGSEIPVADSAAPIIDAEKQIVGAVIVVRDETEKLEMESQILRAQKMQSVGIMAGGIAHDFNNLLSIILGNTELAMEEVPEWMAVHRNLSEIHKASMRGREVVRQLLGFTSQIRKPRETVNLAVVVDEALQFMRATIPSNVAIQKDFEARPQMARADAAQIHQMMVNLCMNAAHAMEPDGGELTVSLKAVDLDEDAIVKYTNLAAGPHVRIVVADTGGGIPPEIIDKIFDPYFTTKPMGKGSGMGLATVHAIVRNHGGEVSVYSEPGQGASMTVYLPLLRSDTDCELVGKETALCGSERILLVDDEPAIVEMEREMLRRLGYAVKAFDSSKAALAAFKSSPGDFDLILTDMTMPELTGVQLLREARRVRSGIPVILATGYSEQMASIRAVRGEIDGFIMKPMIKSEIATVLRKALER